MMKNDYNDGFEQTSCSYIKMENAPQEAGLIDLDGFTEENEEAVVNSIVSIPDALVYSLNNKGKVDMQYICKKSDSSVEDVVRNLKGIIYADPNSYEGNITTCRFLTKDEYLSGNLNIKLKEAYKACELYHGIMEDNVKALKAEISKFPRIKVKDIFVTLSTPWITNFIVECFIRSLLKVTAKVRHDLETGTWSIEAQYGRHGVLCTNTYGTPKMDALSIISRTLNNTPIAIYDTVYKPAPAKIKNIPETLFAIEKQKLIISEFEKWVKNSEERRQYIENLYNEKYGQNKVRVFDGSFLTFPDLNPNVHLYGYQKNAIARIIMSPNTLLCHSCGAGKTYELICAAHELKRMGISKKTLITVPNNIVDQWKSIYNELYPNAKILTVSPKTFVPEKRNEVLKSIINEDFDAIIMAYSCFNMIDLSPEILKEKIKNEEEKIKKSYWNDNSRTSAVKANFTKFRQGKFFDMINALGDKDPEIIYFDDLGIDYLMVDEAHNFKNVPLDTNIKARGINASGSKQCEMMMEKVHYIQRKNGGKGVTFATGTPITNSITDIYVMQLYLQQGDLKLLNFDNFNSWISNFSKLTQDFELDVDACNFRSVARYSKFNNLPELTALLANIADFYNVSSTFDLPEFEQYKDVVIEPSERFEKYLKFISRRADLIRAKEPMRLMSMKNEEIKDNMLLVTLNGRDAALDLRLVGEANDEGVSTKITECANRVFRIFKDTENDKLTQLVFCDTSTPKNNRFNVYDELKDLLIQKGVPSEQIAFIHDADSEKKKNSLFKKVNKGEIRILLGSTQKLGTGVNVQEKLYAIHHLDIPFRPSDFEQRNARIIRPGNTNKQIEIYRYVTKRSFDAYSYQILENKQKFISKLLTNAVNERQADDIDDSVLTYAEVKALAIGNPLIKERVEVQNEISRLINIKNQQSEKLSRIGDLIQSLSEAIPSYQKRIKEAEDDFAYINSSIDLQAIKREEDQMSSLDKKAVVNERRTFGDDICKAYFQNSDGKSEIVVGDYLGFKVIVPSFTRGYMEDRFIHLKRKGSYRLKISDSGIGVIKRMNNFISSFESVIKEYNDTLNQMEANLSQAKKDSKNFIDYESKIRELNEKLLDIDGQLDFKEE